MKNYYIFYKDGIIVTLTNKRKTVNIALIGSGNIGREHAKGYVLAGVTCPKIAATPVLKVLCDVDPERARQKAEEWGFEEYCTDYREILERDDIDIVDICTGVGLHAHLAVEFIKKRKFFVFCEKPLVALMEDGEKIMEAVKEYDWDHRTATAFNKRRYQAIAHASELVKNGFVGDVLTFHGRYNGGMVRDTVNPGNVFPRHAGWADCGSHLTDMCRFILNDHFDEIVAYVGPAVKEVYERAPREGERKEDIPKIKNEFEEYAAIMGKMKKGTPVTLLRNSVYLGAKDDISFELCGTKASLRWSSTNPHVMEICENSSNYFSVGPKTITLGPGYPYGENTAFHPGFPMGSTDQIAFEMYDVVNACVNGTEFAPTFSQTYEIIKVCQAARDSSKSQQWVKVEY